MYHVIRYSPSVVRIDVFNAGKYLVDIFLESSLEPFNNQTLYNDFITELEALLTPWKVKIGRLLVDDERFVQKYYSPIYEIKLPGQLKLEDY